MSGSPHILLIGASGMLGRAWQQTLTARRWRFTPIDRRQLDLADPGAVDQHVTSSYTTVINCAAYTDVDGAEADEDTAMQINGEAAGALASACQRSGALLVHYSTDYVFDGRGTSPWPTNAPRRPVNAYGRSKARGEELIEQAGGKHLIVRTSWLYAPWGKNFVLTMLRLTHEKPSLRVVNDQCGRPTSCGHLAQATAALIDRDARGIYHVTDGGQCTWYELSCEIARQTASDCRIEPCTTDAFPRPAPRPVYSVLDLSETENMIGPMPAWQDNLAAVLGQCERTG